MCFMWIWEQTAIISQYNINWLVFITETECVYCAVNIILVKVILQKVRYVVQCADRLLYGGRFVAVFLWQGMFTFSLQHYDMTDSSLLWHDAVSLDNRLLPYIAKERGVFETSECGYPMTRRHIPAELTPHRQHHLILSLLCPVTMTIMSSHDHGCRDFGFSQCKHFICAAHATCSADLFLIIWSSLLPPATASQHRARRHPLYSSLNADLLKLLWQWTWNCIHAVNNDTVKPRFTNASDHERFGLRTNFPNTKRLGWRTVSRVTNTQALKIVER